MRIAQLSDLHLLEPDFASRTFTQKFRARFLSVGRPLDYERRREQFARGLAAATARGFDHLLLSGDLTEEGEPSQFEVVAELLHDALASAGVAKERVTLLAGNHDVYAHADGWLKAMAGPFAASAIASRFNEPIDLAGITLIPVDTTRTQHYVLSAGELDLAHWQAVRTLTLDRARQGRTVVIVMHHPPRAHAFAPLQWIDGLRNARLVHALLAECPNAHVIHGHTHKAVAEVWPGSTSARVFSPRSVVESPDALRMYDVDGAGVRVVEAASLLAAA